MRECLSPVVVARYDVLLAVTCLAALASRHSPHGTRLTALASRHSPRGNLASRPRGSPSGETKTGFAPESSVLRWAASRRSSGKSRRSSGKSRRSSAKVVVPRQKSSFLGQKSSFLGQKSSFLGQKSSFLGKSRRSSAKVVVPRQKSSFPQKMLLDVDRTHSLHFTL